MKQRTTTAGATASRVPSRPSDWPPLGNAFTRWLGRGGLALLGWRFRGTLPSHPRLVIIVAPHTSNWDFFIGVFALLAVGARVCWMGKHSIFRWPVNRLLRALGGIPVTRHAAADVVEQLTEAFARQPRMLLALSPEGTRRRRGRFKTGFLRIAHRADVPVLPIGLDYGTRHLVVGKPFVPSADVVSEERAYYEHFRRFRGRHPDQY